MTTLAPSVAQLFDLARDGRPRPAIDLVLQLLADGVAVDQLITEVLAPVQLEVGLRWETNRWDVAEEHAATAVVDGVLGALALHTLVPDAPRATVLVACAEGEHHTLPARMGTELLRHNGWEVTFLGGSLPADDLQRYAGVADPAVVVISCTVPLFLSGARRCFAAINEIGLPGVAAGAAFGNDDVRARRLGASGWLGSAAHLPAVLDDPQGWGPQASPTPPEVFAIELAADELERSCMAALADRMPQLATYSAAQLASTRTDVGYILSYLATSIDLGDDEIFEAFASWLARVLDARGVPTFVLDQLLDTIGQVMASAGLTDAARLCSTPRGMDAS